MKELKIGATEKIADDEFIILEVKGDEVICLSKNIIFSRTIFSCDTNNFANSYLYKKLNGEYLEKLENAIGAENIVEQEIDLTAVNGSKEYGSVKCKVGIITLDLYVKYRNIIKSHKVNDTWWLATPTATENDGDCKYWVSCLLPYGFVYYHGCRTHYGVRALCTFKSDIFKS